MLPDPSAVVPPGTSTYQDEHALATYLALELERRLAGRDQPVLVRRVPGDVCHLGVLAPVGASTRGFAPAPTDDSAGSEASGGSHVTTLARRSPTALGVQILLAPNGDDPIRLRICPRFAIYTRHFATWDEQRRELGDSAAVDTTTGADARHAVRLIDICVRRPVVQLNQLDHRFAAAARPADR